MLTIDEEMSTDTVGKTFSLSLKLIPCVDKIRIAIAFSLKPFSDDNRHVQRYVQAFRAENEGLLRAVDPAFTRQPNGNQQSGRDLTMKGHEYGNQSGGDLTMKSHEHGNQLGGAISTEEFVARLKTLRIHHEAINDTYDQLQMTFGLKLLLDIVTNVFAVLSVIAWFSMW